MSDSFVQPAPMEGVRYDPPPAVEGASTVFGVSHRDFAAGISDPERLKAWKAFTDDFWRVDSAGAPPSRNSFLFRRGFLRDKWALYDLGRNDIEQYLSDLQLRLLYRANTIYAHVLENRLIQYQVLQGTFRTPQVYAIRDPERGEVVFFDAWEAAQKPGGGGVTAYVQPLNSSARGKVAVFHVAGGEFEGGEKSGPVARMDAIVRDWARAAGSPYLIVERLEPGAFSRELSPDSLNLLHVLMYRERESWAPRMFGAVLRIGTRASGSSDLIEDGGLSAWINPETGRIERVLRLGATGQLEELQHHPDSDMQLVGLAVPGWETFGHQLAQFYDQSSYLRVAGFDFLMQDEGFAFVGASNMPDVAAIQAHAPLLRDPLLAEFLRREKI